jgi:alanine dehydrogenase
MESNETLLLQRKDVARLLSIEECMNAVEKAFGLFAEGRASPPKILGLHADNGGFHIKAGLLGLGRNYFVAKVNANFPGNPIRYGLPTIQGVIVVCDATNGSLLALMDSIEITIIRTGAATGIAAKYLANVNATVATICGCGNQGRISLKALMKVRKLERIFAYDIDEDQIDKFVTQFGKEITTIPTHIIDLPAALIQSQIVVTCTTSKEPFINAKDIMPGTFIAAVGADSEDKQELFADLVATSKIVVDLAEQSAAIGELHHAIRQNLISVEHIHAELGQIITGKKAGRESVNEIIIFDSTGMALQDVAAAAIVYEKAMQNGIGQILILGQQESEYAKIS